tara:strand:- start:606 stop:851 length:246 start_codon:yes stop_codon:yes gene_type:complete
MSKLGDWWKRIIREEYHLIITVPVEVITTDGMTTERFKEKQYAAKKIIKATPKHFIFKDLKNRKHEMKFMKPMNFHIIKIW